MTPAGCSPSVFILNEEDWAEFERVMQEPAEPNAMMRAAAKLHEQLRRPASLPSGVDVDEIRKRRAAIDGSPWRYKKIGQTIWGHSRGGCSQEPSDYMVANVRGWGHLQYMGETRGDAKSQALQDANGEFIAHAPLDIDTLLRTLTARDAELAALKAALALERWGIDEIGSGLSSEHPYAIARMVIDRRAALEGKP